MRLLKAVFFLGMLHLCADCVHSQQQTDEQKQAMDRRKKVLLNVLVEKQKLNEPIYNMIAEPLIYLLRRQKGIPFVEDRIIEYRKKDKMEAWEVALDHYCKAIPPEDIPDRIVAELLVQAKQKPNAVNMYLIGEFGPRAKAFVPVLESIRDKSMDDAIIRLANDTIRRIK